MTMPISTTVLVVGAGPSGLSAALSLIHHGCKDFIIVDAVEERENTSRALVVHAATLEALDTIHCGEEIVEKGIKIRTISFGNRSSQLVSADLSTLDKHTCHPYALIIPQNLTEHILGEKLKRNGVVVHRRCKATFLKRNEQNDQLTDVTFEGGKVRQMAGIGFTDPLAGEKGDRVINLAQIVLADVVYEGGDNDGFGFGGTMTPESFFFSMPMPKSFNEFLARDGREEEQVDGQIYRIGSGVPLVDGEIPHSPNKEYLQNLIDRFGPMYLSSDSSVNPRSRPVRIKEVVWSTRFRTHSAVADKVFTRLGVGGDELKECIVAPVVPYTTTEHGGVILLIGDAAHIHSPAGGQGMNLGIRDAVFLGETLTKHMNASASDSEVDKDHVLRTFAEVRHKRALEVIAFTKTLLSLLGAQDKKISWMVPVSAATVRDWMLWFGGKFSFVQARMAWAMSGLGRR